MTDTFALLRSRFHHALLLGLGAPAWLAGCGPGEGIENDEGFVEVMCNQLGPMYLDGLEPLEPVDYIGRGYGPLESTVAFNPVEEVGEPCASASDVDACMATIAEPPIASTLQLGEADYFLGYSVIRATRGDDVIEINSPAALRDFIVPIDTPADAVLLASSAGYSVTCNRSGARPAGTSGYTVQLFTHQGCDGRRRHLIYVNTAGEMVHLDGVTEREADPNCVVGRRPAGLIARRAAGRSVGAHFARSAELEAASVPAFETLERELLAHGAPASFAARARLAARDEVMHARDVARLARKLGGRPCKPRVVPLAAARSLEAIALENAIEGCVRETYGALVARHQAARARLPAVRRLYARIGVDETRHAALAWDIARWVESRIGAAARRRVRSATRDAVLALHESAREPVSPALADIAGLPTANSAAAMLGALQQTLWSNPR
jgi:hypothetical protein